MPNYAEAPGKRCLKCGGSRLLRGNGGPLSFFCPLCDEEKKVPPPPVDLDHVEDRVVKKSDGSYDVVVDAVDRLTRGEKPFLADVVTSRVDTITPGAIGLIEEGLERLVAPGDIKTFKKIVRMKQLLKELKEVYCLGS